MLSIQEVVLESELGSGDYEYEQIDMNHYRRSDGKYLFVKTDGINGYLVDMGYIC